MLHPCNIGAITANVCVPPQVFKQVSSANLKARQVSSNPLYTPDILLICMECQKILLYDGCNDAVDNWSNQLSVIIEGYSTDPWFHPNNTAELELYNNLHYKGNALMIPNVPELKRVILSKLHAANCVEHVGVHKTQHNLQRRYCRPRLATNVHEYVRGCLTCQRNKSSNSFPAGKIQPIAVPHHQWEHATGDRIGGLPKAKRGHTAILVVVDKFSKMTRFAPVRTEAMAADIAQAFVEHVWNSLEMPLQITTDRGTEFTNAFSKSLCEMIGTRHDKSTSYHPQTDGQTEHMKKVLEDMMRHYIAVKMYTWDLMLPPFYLNYDRHPRMPDDLVADKSSRHPGAYSFIRNIEQAMTKPESCMRGAQMRMKQYADLQRVAMQCWL